MPDASRPAGPSSAPAEGAPVYSERIWIPVWWWLIGAGIAALVGYELHLAFRSVPSWVFIVALQPVSIALGLWLSRSRLTVTAGDGGELHIHGRAHLPRQVVSRTMAVPATARRAAMGRQLDPAAFVFQRPWVGPLALIVLDDPDDPTPYWLVSTRHPQRLLDALGAPQSSISDAAAGAEGR